MKKLLCAILAGFSLFCFNTHSNGIIPERHLEGSLASLHKRYWGWSPVMGYHLYMDTELLVQAFTAEPKSNTDQLLHELFVFDQENKTVCAQNQLDHIAAYLTPKIIGVIATYCYYFSAFQREALSTGQSPAIALGGSIYKRLAPRIRKSFEAQAYHLAEMIHESISETTHALPLNYILMTFLCMRARSDKDIRDYLNSIPQHFFHRIPLTPVNLDFQSIASDDFLSMNQNTIPKYCLIEKLFLQHCPSSTPKETKQIVDATRAVIINQYASTNTQNPNLINIDRELFLATTKKDVSVAIKIGADVNIANRFGATPLHCAVIAGNLTVARALLYHNANTAALDNRQYTPLMHAASGASAEMVVLLLDYEENETERIKCARQVRVLARNHYIEQFLDQVIRGYQQGATVSKKSKTRSRIQVATSSSSHESSSEGAVFSCDF